MLFSIIMEANASYTISSGGTLSSYSDSWNGWYDGGTWSGGTQLESFTSNGVVTTIGTSSGVPNIPGGEGMGGEPGGW